MQALRCLKGQRAILDGEIVVLDEKGRSNFWDLMAHQGEPRYYAFDLMWLNGVDLRSRLLLERKERLRRLISRNDTHLLYVEHLDGDGRRFFELACEQDLEGVSRPGESHPEALAELYVSLSTHTAPITEPCRTPICQWANSCGSRREMRAIHRVARRR
jgi:hypothetical protein